MITAGYSSDHVSSDEEEEVVNQTALTGRKNVVRDKGKRKMAEENRAMRQFESLDLVDSDDDVLVVGTEEDDLLLGSDDDAPPSGAMRPKLLVTKKFSETQQAEVSKENEESAVGKADSESVCHMKWLRTVGFQGGSLVCTVSNADNVSDSGVSGKTESLNADTIKGMVEVYRKRRAEIVDTNGVVATPLHIVKKLAQEHAETLHCEVLGFDNGYHRVELFSGSVRGLGEGINKRIAAQMAAIDLLERVQLSGGTIKIPLVGFLPGWLTSDRVFGDLIALCQARGLPRPKIISKNNVDENGKRSPGVAPFRAECWVGEDLVTVGESEHNGFARREAAKEMYNLLTNSEYRDNPYAIGRCCRRADELQAAGYTHTISDYKKKWLLKYRVVERQLQIPEEEAGMDSICDIQDLEKVLNSDNKYALGYEDEYELKRKKLKITVPNKKVKFSEDVPPESQSSSRCVSVENLAQDDWY